MPIPGEAFMTESRYRHKVQDGAFGVLHALWGIGVHRIEILDERGKMIGVGKGETEAAAREQAWKDVNRKD